MLSVQDFKITSMLFWLLTITPFVFKAQVSKTDSLHYYKRDSYLSDNPKQSGLDLLVDSVLASFMQSLENCGISLGISTAGGSYFYNYGEIRRNSGVLPQRNTIYETGALSASFCGILLSLAVKEKKISPEDEVRMYLPGKNYNLSYNKAAVKIKHLAEHTSGLPQIPGDLTRQENFDAHDPYKNYSREQIFNYLHTAVLSTEPGRAYDYSSLGIALLGIILERVYNTSFDTLIKERICLPNNMINTAVELESRQKQYLASAYTSEGDSTSHWHMNAFAAAGGIKSSTKDMLSFLNSNLEEKDQKPEFSWLRKKTKQGNTLFYQTGGTYGSGGFSGFIKEKKCSVIILANSGRDVEYIAIALLNYLQK